MWPTMLLQAGMELINKFFPDPAQKAEAQLKLLQLQQAGEFKELEARLQEMQMQADINKVEAANTNTFVSGARPFVMWVGGLGVAYQWLVMPLVTFVYTLHTGHDIPVHPPAIDPNLIWMLGGLLGLQHLARSYEKSKGVA